MQNFIQTIHNNQPNVIDLIHSFSNFLKSNGIDLLKRMRIAALLECVLEESVTTLQQSKVKVNIEVVTIISAKKKVVLSINLFELGAKKKSSNLLVNTIAQKESILKELDKGLFAIDYSSLKNRDLLIFNEVTYACAAIF